MLETVNLPLRSCAIRDNQSLSLVRRSADRSPCITETASSRRNRLARQTPMIEALIIGSVAVAIGAVVLGIIVGSQFLPVRIWFLSVVIFSIPQIYFVPVAGIYPSLVMLASLLHLYSYRYLPEFAKLGWVRAFIALLAVHAISILWSPEPLQGVRHLVYLAPFLGSALIGYAFTTEQEGKAFAYIHLALWTTGIQASAVILFRLAPELEFWFIRTSFASIFISPNVIAALFDGSPNNIFDAGKSGGLFVNANTASAIMGFCGMVAWNLSARPGLGSLRAVALVHWVAIFFTGSKAGAMLAIATPALLFLYGASRVRKVSLESAIVIFIGGAVLVASLPLMPELMRRSTFLSDASETMLVRRVIWQFAYDEFLRSPILGLGFGGWERLFPYYAYVNRVSPNYPAHNAFLIAWVQSGMLAPAALIAFMILFLRWVLRSSTRHVHLGVGLFMGTFWFWIQAQGENFGILGEQHFTPLLRISPAC